MRIASMDLIYFFLRNIPLIAFQVEPDVAVILELADLAPLDNTLVPWTMTLLLFEKAVEPALIVPLLTTSTGFLITESRIVPVSSIAEEMSSVVFSQNAGSATSSAEAVE